jgi:hypothetical protein
MARKYVVGPRLRYARFSITSSAKHQQVHLLVGSHGGSAVMVLECHSVKHWLLTAILSTLRLSSTGTVVNWIQRTSLHIHESTT